jgi:GNAT superfamily N-acetyltransferase
VSEALDVADLVELCDRENALVLIGLYADSPAGIGVIEANKAAAPPASKVHCLYVEPGFRRVGVAETLLGALEQFSARVGCDRIDVPVLPGSIAAKAFFEAAGYRARLLTMERRFFG